MNAELVSEKIAKSNSRTARRDSRAQDQAVTETVAIDYPAEGEVITSSRYTVRISTGIPAARVDVSIDGGIWKPCRESVGNWWFDWERIKAKTHELHARVRARDGTLHVTPVRKFIVKQQ